VLKTSELVEVDKHVFQKLRRAVDFVDFP
jgi:hypothetical protein